jgi:uncharacterized protein
MERHSVPRPTTARHPRVTLTEPYAHVASLTDKGGREVDARSIYDLVGGPRRLGTGGGYLGPVSGHDQHAGRPGEVGEFAAGRQERVAGLRDTRAGLALVVVLGAAVTWNLAANLWLPWALYVPGALVLAATLVGVAVRIGGCRWSDLGLDRREFRRGLAYGAAVALPVTVILALGAALPATRGLFQDRRAAGISTAVLLYVILVRVPLGTVVLEETLFRGVLLGLGLRRWSQTMSVTVSCLAFGLWHVLPARHVASFNPVFTGLAGGQLGWLYGVVAAVVATAVAGLVLCWLRLRSRSLLAPALLHATVNGLGYGLAFLAGRAP